jgi:hypothetical protein
LLEGGARAQQHHGHDPHCQPPHLVRLSTPATACPGCPITPGPRRPSAEHLPERDGWLVLASSRYETPARAALVPSVSSVSRAPSGWRPRVIDSRVRRAPGPPRVPRLGPDARRKWREDALAHAAIAAPTSSQFL